MKLKNKKTGGIIILIDHIFDDYKNLAEFNEEWEDYEEPKEYWYIDCYGEIHTMFGEPKSDIMCRKLIGNYFETKEEAELALRKLKAWKRLKDKGFKFSRDCVHRYDQPFVKNHTYFEFVAICEDGALFDDLDLLFGGEE